MRGRGERPLGISVARPEEPASRWKQELACAWRPRAHGVLLARGGRRQGREVGLGWLWPVGHYGGGLHSEVSSLSLLFVLVQFFYFAFLFLI